MNHAQLALGGKDGDDEREERKKERQTEKEEERERGPSNIGSKEARPIDAKNFANDRARCLAAKKCAHAPWQQLDYNLVNSCHSSSGIPNATLVIFKIEACWLDGWMDG